MPIDQTQYVSPPAVFASLRLALCAGSRRPRDSLSPALRAAIFFLAALLHVAMLQGLSLWTPKVVRVPGSSAALQVRLITPETIPPPPRPEARRDSRARERASGTDKPLAAPPAPPKRSTAPVDNASPAPQPDTRATLIPPEAITPPPGSGLMDDALRSAGRIDRELRQQMPWQGGGQSASSGTRLERSVAAGGRARFGATEQMTLGDGTRVTKVYGAGGVYCIYNRGVGMTAGRDVTQNGTQQFTANCPQ